MKYIIIITLMAFIVSASVSAQTKKVATAGNPKAGKIAVAPKDTIFNFNLTLSQTKILLDCMSTTLNLLPRSADLTALQASEAQKQVYTIGKVITDQLPKAAASKDSISKK